MKTDILNENDLRNLVDIFYGRVLNDEDLKPFFQKLNFETHIPKMVQFWSFAIFETPGYTTNLFQAHQHMPLKKVQFSAWLALFNQTIDDLFEGPNALKAKQRAMVIALGMESKIVS